MDVKGLPLCYMLYSGREFDILFRTFYKVRFVIHTIMHFITYIDFSIFGNSALYVVWSVCDWGRDGCQVISFKWFL
jgi:hypothetical protein